MMPESEVEERILRFPTAEVQSPQADTAIYYDVDLVPRAHRLHGHRLASADPYGTHNFIVAEVETRIESLFARMEELQAIVKDLQTKADTIERVIVLREISDKDAKAEIKKFFEANHGKEIFPSDIANELGLAFEQAFRLCLELESDGEIDATKPK